MEKSFLSLSKLTFFTLLFFPTVMRAQSTYLTVEDTRNAATLPADYRRQVKSSFKFGSAVGLPDVGYTYYTLLGLRGWVDDTGGSAHELAFSSGNGIFYRTGSETAGWRNWRKIISENVTGNVGIGIDNPNEKLAVNGTIRAKEIKVEASPWPDYVFEEDYQLPSLKETEQFIKANKHLPEVPSAKEVEGNGVALGEMNAILLKKVEELTLHLIEKDKQFEEQTKQINQLKIAVEQLQNSVVK